MRGKGASEAGVARDHRLQLARDLLGRHGAQNGLDCGLCMGRFRADKVEKEIKRRLLPGQANGGKQDSLEPRIVFLKEAFA